MGWLTQCHLSKEQVVGLLNLASTCTSGAWHPGCQPTIALCTSGPWEVIRQGKIYAKMSTVELTAQGKGAKVT